jgi:CRP/FNR family transcriptional regulator
MVLNGRLRVYSISPKGNEATLYTIEPGETCVLALNCLFNDLVYPAWVDAESDTQVAIIPGSIYRNLFTTETAVQDLTVHALSTLVFRLMDELGDLHGLNQRQRLARLLLTRSSSSGELKVTQQQIADHLGTRREVVARYMVEFVDAGLVATGRGKLQLLDMDKLRAIVSS